MKILVGVFLILTQIIFSSEINLKPFYENEVIMSNKEVDNRLDEILDILNKNPKIIDKEFDKEKIITYFLFNNKVFNTGKFDFNRIKKVLKFKPDLNYNIYHFEDSSPIQIVIFYNYISNIKKRRNFQTSKNSIKNGADTNKYKVLQSAYSADRFDIFSYLIKNETKNADGVFYPFQAIY